MEQPQLGQYMLLFTCNPVPNDVVCLLRDFLDDHPRLRFLRLQWQDYSGVLRARLVTPRRLLAVTIAQKPIHVPPIAFHCVVDNMLLPKLDPTGNHFLIPDWSSLRLVPSNPHNGMIMCGVLATSPARPLPNVDFCPRRALASVVSRAAQQLDIHFLVGFEVEFEVFERATEAGDCSDNAIVPASTALGRFAVDGLRVKHFPLLEQAVHQLLDSGVNVEAMQTEGRYGQYELSLGPRAPMEAVDELILVHDTLKTIFARHDLVVTMSPKPIHGRRQAAGQHTHVSISRPEAECEFLAGILHRLPALCAVCLPYDQSYERVQPYLAGNTVAWGTENREVPVRKIRPGHWEIRCVDATANMYLALATILGSGLLGLEKQQPLRWPDTAYPSDSCMDCTRHTTNGAHHGVKPLELPQNLATALDLLEREATELNQIMNGNILDHFLRVKRFEASCMAKKEPREARDLLTKLF